MRKVIHVRIIFYFALYPCVGTQCYYKICCDSSARLALQYSIAKLTVRTSMYKIKVDKPWVYVCMHLFTYVHSTPTYDCI